MIVIVNLPERSVVTPHAIIFGLWNRWAKAFADLYTQPPD